jgi:hypothetical protein
MTNFPFKSADTAREVLGEYLLFSSINVYTLRPLPDNVSLLSVLGTIEERIPQVFFHNIDSIYIGHFEEFEKRSINAFYSHGALFVTNDQSSEADLIDDIVHETAHAVEKMFPEHIYDASLESEFLSKREKLFNRLKREGWDFKISQFLDTHYTREFDELLYMEIGYPSLASLTHDLFNSPYGITSLQEYWANGFEAYFLGDAQRIKSLSPQVYKKITTLIEKYK